MSSYVPLYKPVKILWLAGILAVAGLTLRHVPAWRSLCLTPTTAVGRIVANNLEHGKVRYLFQVEGKGWDGTAPGYHRDGTRLDPYQFLEVFYASSDPSINQLERPAPGDWWRHAVSYFLFYSVFPVTILVGMAQRFVQWLYDRTMDD